MEAYITFFEASQKCMKKIETQFFVVNILDEGLAMNGIKANFFKGIVTVT